MRNYGFQLMWNKISSKVTTIGRQTNQERHSYLFAVVSEQLSDEAMTTKSWVMKSVKPLTASPSQAPTTSSPGRKMRPIDSGAGTQTNSPVFLVLISLSTTIVLTAMLSTWRRKPVPRPRARPSLGSEEGELAWSGIGESGKRGRKASTDPEGLSWRAGW